MKFASIVPLIGGETIGMQQALNGQRPEYLLSYTPFTANDEHLVKYYGDVPYHLLDKNPFPDLARVDIVNSTCPCAGLSSLSTTASSDSKHNDWMYQTAEYVLENVRPAVFWGENAPGLMGVKGESVRARLHDIAAKNGYTMSFYKTKTILHGGPQVRQRSFYFFWRGNKTPVLNWYDVPHEKIEDVFARVKTNFQHEPINKAIPSQVPSYAFVLNYIHGGITHAEFSAQLGTRSARTCDVIAYIESKGIDFDVVAAWMRENGHVREAEKYVKRKVKLASGGQIMRRDVIVPKDYIGAFVAHYPQMLAHPTLDRFVTYREAMMIMGMPDDFELVNASQKNVNHIAQNVPVQTAKHMAQEVLAALDGQREMIDTDLIMQYNGTEQIDYSKRELTLDEHFV